MQITNNNNTSPTFGAKLIFVDKGKCFSLKQKFQLKQLAKKIGDNSDRFYIGTRKYDNVGIYNSDLHFWRKDMQILSSVKGVSIVNIVCSIRMFNIVLKKKLLLIFMICLKKNSGKFLMLRCLNI